MSLDSGVYWVGDVPSRPLDITVLDDDLRPVDLSMYSDLRLAMVGSDNEEVDLLDGNLVVTNRREGKVRWYWPSKTVFTKPGQYELQLVLSNGAVRDSTTARTIYVRKLGGRK